MTAHAQSTTADVTEASHAQAVSYSAYTNVDEQARAFDGWSATYTQISGGVFHGSLSTVTLGGVRLLVEELDKVIYQQGAIAPDRQVIAVPLELEGHARLCGEKSGRDSLHVFSSVPQFEFYSPDRHVLVNVEIQSQHLASDRSSVAAASLRERALAPVIPLDADIAEKLRALLRVAMAASTRSAQDCMVESEERERLLERTILYAISEALAVYPDEVNLGRERPVRHWVLVKAVDEKLQDAATCPLSIAELCADLGISRRTVQYAFQEALDLNPVAYLRAVRLNHVRRELRLGATVTNAATKWGFLHLGSFASDYRRMFGELPSTTVRRFAA
ncbi:helix-turn-helix domain-containing protein [Paraburkholderia sp. Tr-20389]|uniref:helix-turn-helix domain-containing protein n=1 Tax=Paraburkholderia sp. Tr-20389 TaxID=2703903 RepID=UPI00198093F5|nr:helix-turn-helix domain-containing protein [Paraburkholderia sp. Tr-20389]MBN3756561.1 helix-turn-helix domain-containing protein [Paraburkholderia sp. Tr-20389]